MWFVLAAVVGLTISLGYVVWRKWVVPWRSIEAVVDRIAHGEKPGTFLINGGAGPRRVGLALEDLFNRSQEFNQQTAERTAGAQTIFAALHDGLLVVDMRHRVTLVNRTFQQLFGPREDFAGTASARSHS